jgi:hypothetical protein
MIRARIRDRLDGEERAVVARFLGDAGLTDCFMP